MKSSLLFPPVFRIVGIILLIAGLILVHIYIDLDQVIAFLDYGPGNLTDELAITLIITGLIFIGFSRSIKETERIGKLRLNALYWAVLINLALMSVLWLIQHQEEAIAGSVTKPQNPLEKVFNYNLFLLLILFIARFYYLKATYKKDRKGKQLYLLPNNPYQQIGKLAFVLYLGSLFIPATNKFDVKYYALFILLLPGIAFWIWSKERDEVNVIKTARLKSMQIAVYINYSIF